jgi:hypothetical protein
VGFFLVNTTASDGLEHARRAFATPGMRCACLFSSMHHYPLDDERVAALFEVAAAHRGAIFAHCGYLSIEARTKLGLPTMFDLRFGDPLALASTAARFPGVPVIIPHFGGGFFREALMAAEACPSIHFDTSSSNDWIKFVPNLTLADVFRRAIAVAGAHRILFGTTPHSSRALAGDSRRSGHPGDRNRKRRQGEHLRGNFDRLHWSASHRRSTVRFRRRLRTGEHLAAAGDRYDSSPSTMRRSTGAA